MRGIQPSHPPTPTKPCDADADELADSSTDQKWPEWRGLSDKGERSWARPIGSASTPERKTALAALWQTARKPNLTLGEREAVIARKHEIDRRWPVPRASFEDAFAHLLHAARVAGVDHVGIGADFDGGDGVIGFEDARDYPKITARLASEGFSRDDIQKIWSGNVLRILRVAEAFASQPAGPPRSAPNGR